MTATTESRRRGRRRPLRRVLATVVAFAIVIGIAVAARAWHDTMADPIVRRATVGLAGFPSDAAPVRIALLSDIHPAAPDMTTARVRRIVAKVNALQPDIVVIAGDFISDRPLSTRIYSVHDSIAPLAELHAPLGVFAVLGNHEQWGDVRAISRELARNRITLLRNKAERTGPIALGGVDYLSRGGRQLERTLAAMKALGGAPVVLSHSPYIFPDAPPGPLLMLSGHTHCGQIDYPWGGTPAPDISGYRNHYLCGLMQENGRTLIMTAGLGTSVIPVRFLAPPDVWLVEVRAPAKTAAGSLRRP